MVNAGENVKNLDHSDIPDGNIKSYCHSKKQFAVFVKKKKHVTYIQPSNCSPEHLLLRNE